MHLSLFLLLHRRRTGRDRGGANLLLIYVPASDTMFLKFSRREQCIWVHTDLSYMLRTNCERTYTETTPEISGKPQRTFQRTILKVKSNKNIQPHAVPQITYTRWNQYRLSKQLRWCLHDTGMNFIPERLAWFVSRLHGRSHSGVKML